MKYFSLLYSGDVHPAAGQKIIPAEEYSLLLSAQEIIEKAEEDVQTLKAKAKESSKKQKKKGYEEGFAEGLEELNKHIIYLSNEMKEMKLHLQQSIIPLALKAAKKIVGGELKTHPDTIVNIVTNALKPVTQCRHVRIYLNKDDKIRLEAEKKSIKQILDHAELFAVEARADIEPGGCIIETEKGIINASLENQWRALEAAFENFMKR